MPNIKYSEEQKQQAIKLREEGLTFQEISDKTGIKNTTTISEVCEKAGLPKTHRSPKHNYGPGQRFNNFVILEIAPSKSSNETGQIFSRWRCKCDCGKIFLITTKQIYRGQKSCGCLSITSRFHQHEPQEVIITSRLSRYINGAKRRNLSWELTREQFASLLFGNCSYCGAEPTQLVKLNKHIAKVNGIDRVNNNLGYFIDNCKTCCQTCNMAKYTLSFDDFILWIKKIVNFWKDKF